VSALYPDLSRNGKWAIIDGITKDRKREDEIEFVDKKASNESTNEASVIRAAIQERRADLGLANLAEKISELKNGKERYHGLILRYFVFLDRELERKAEMKLSGEKNEEWERRKAFLTGKRFNGVPLCNIKSHFVSIDFGVHNGIMRDINPEFDASREDFTGENRETYWKDILDFKRLKMSKQKVFKRMMESDRVAMCVHYGRFKTDRPVLPSAEPVTKHGEKEKEDPATQQVEDNDFVVGADPGNTNIITIAAPKRAEDVIDGSLRQKDMRTLGFSRARYYRESGIMNARKKIETWNEGMKDRLEAMSEVTSRNADFQAFLKFMEVRVAHWDALWEEYTKPRWVRLRMNVYGGRQRAFANFFQSVERLEGG